MGLFNLFSKAKKQAPIQFSALEVDMHSHLIPGIDDGARSMDHTIAMLAKFESLGYKKVITTPHVYSDCYKNTPEIILEGCKLVQQTAKELGLRIEIEAAAEYYCDEYFMELIEQKNLLPIANKYILMEFPFLSRMDNWEEFIFKVQSVGYTPIIAHFERYVYWHGSLKEAQRMRELGAKIQLNINSLTGHYGPEIRKQGEKLVDNKLVDFFATDCHRMQHLLLMEGKAYLPYFHKVMNENTLLNATLL